MKNFALILNPLSLAKNAKRVARLIETFKALGHPYKIYETMDSGSITSETRRALDLSHSHILPIGGDGTLSLAAKAFMSGKSNLYPDATLIPCDFGTGHDFYNGFIPKSFHGDYGWIAHASERVAVSVGSFESRGEIKYFLNSLSLGISSQIVESRERSRFRHGRTSYFLATLSAIQNYHSDSIEVSVDGESFGGRTLLLLFSKGPFVGGGMRIAAKADSESASCEGIWIPDMSFGDIVRNFPKLYRGGVSGVRGVKTFNFKQLECRFNRSPQYVEADGELCRVDDGIKLEILAPQLYLLRPMIARNTIS